MELTLTNERIRELIPNVIHEVRSEALLIDKLQPWLASAQTWVEDNFTGTEYEPSEAVQALVERIVVQKAFAEAAPSLDVVLSPTGFGVVSTESLAPASKERVERLIATLNSSVDSNSKVLLDRLHEDEAWRESSIGQWWLGTLMPTLRNVYRYQNQNAMLDAYRTMREIAVRFEQTVADEYLGQTVMDELRSGQMSDWADSRVLQLLRNAELRYIGYHMRDQKAKCPDEHEVWHLVKPVLEQLPLHTRLHEMWQTEMGEKFRPAAFKNNIKGGYYF